MSLELSGFARSQARNPIFWDFGEFIGEHATSLCALLQVDAASQEGQSPGWSQTDTDAFESWAELEADVDILPIPEDLDDRGVRQLEEYRSVLHTFHTALPFSEAERGWLLGVYHQDVKPRQNPQGEDILPELLSRHEERIITAGIRQVVTGRELTRRWVAWSRGAEEYVGQHTLDIACTALGQLVRLFAVPDDVPKPPYNRRES